MKKVIQQHYAIFFAVFIVSCDNNVTISKSQTFYDPRVHLSKVDLKEKLPYGVKEILEQQSTPKDSIPKFPLSYYLISEEDARFLHTKAFNEKITEQLIRTISGTKYYKLFVHPDTDAAYAFLKHAYRYIGPTETEFVASPVAGEKTLVVWTGKVLTRKAFIVTTQLDEEALKEINARFPASDTPEIASLIFNRPIKGSKEKIEGQQITDIPEFTYSK